MKQPKNFLFFAAVGIVKKRNSAATPTFAANGDKPQHAAQLIYYLYNIIKAYFSNFL